MPIYSTFISWGTALKDWNCQLGWMHANSLKVMPYLPNVAFLIVLPSSSKIKSFSCSLLCYLYKTLFCGSKVSFAL